MSAFLVFMAIRNLVGAIASFWLSTIEDNKTNKITGYGCLFLFVNFISLYLFASPMFITIYLYSYVFSVMGILILTKAYLYNKLGFYSEAICCAAALYLLII